MRVSHEYVTVDPRMVMERADAEPGYGDGFTALESKTTFMWHRGSGGKMNR